MRNITKFKRSIRAISPVISVLLMIAIAVVASIFAYAWVTGYIGGQTEKAGNEIQVQSYSLSGNLFIYVQNTGQGTVHLKQDASVYINDVLQTIRTADDKVVDSGSQIPINAGQTVKIEVNYDHFKAGDKIKIVTVEGTSMQVTGNNNSGTSSSVAHATVTFIAGPGGSISPSGIIHDIAAGIPYSLYAYPNAGFVFSSWTFSGPIYINNPTSVSPSMYVTGTGIGQVMGNFVPASNPKLNFAAGAGQSIDVNALSSVITIQRQDASSNPTTTGSLIVTLTTPPTGTFYY